MNESLSSFNPKDNIKIYNNDLYSINIYDNSTTDSNYIKNKETKDIANEFLKIAKEKSANLYSNR